MATEASIEPILTATAFCRGMLYTMLPYSHRHFPLAQNCNFGASAVPLSYLRTSSWSSSRASPLKHPTSSLSIIPETWSAYHFLNAKPAPVCELSFSSAWSLWYSICGKVESAVFGSRDSETSALKVVDLMPPGNVHVYEHASPSRNGAAYLLVLELYQ